MSEISDEVVLDSIHRLLLPLTAPRPQLPPQSFSLLVAALVFRVADGHMAGEDCGALSLIFLFLSRV